MNKVVRIRPKPVEDIIQLSLTESEAKWLAYLLGSMTRTEFETLLRSGFKAHGETLSAEEAEEASKAFIGSTGKETDIYDLLYEEIN